MKRTQFINLPLHGGHPPAYLVRRMIRLSYYVSKIIVDQYGSQEFLRRLSDPLWFQAFGCVLGFDWHSSGVTTVVTGVLKQSLVPDVHGISLAGGKGARANSAIYHISNLAQNFGLSGAKVNSLLYASKMSAKVDNAAVQDGYSLYHHVIMFNEHGDWIVVQQGMNSQNKMARRYHWASDSVVEFICEPHSGIICAAKSEQTLDMTSKQSHGNQVVSLDIARGNPENLKSSFYRLRAGNTLDCWLGVESVPLSGYEMPLHLDWDLYRRIYDIQPRNYEELLAIRGVGATTIRALALIAELIHNAPASRNDPVKYSFAHGGKDGLPYPVARKVYDRSISYLQGAIEGAELERAERNEALKKLARFSQSMFA